MRDGTTTRCVWALLGVSNVFGPLRVVIARSSIRFRGAASIAQKKSPSGEAGANVEFQLNQGDCPDYAMADDAMAAA
jgi:hypothetical protein